LDSAARAGFAHKAEDATEIALPLGAKLSFAAIQMVCGFESRVIWMGVVFGVDEIGDS
jgi:hypothetical protein